MTVRPIIFSGPMIRALLEGRKTQTRRLAWRDAERGAGIPVATVWQRVKPGDLLWVREAFAEEHPLAIARGRYSREGHAVIPGPPPVNYRAIYRADGDPLQIWRRADNEHPYFTLDGPADDIAAAHPSVCSNFQRDGKSIYWTSSIHMPRWGSRLTLEVTTVRQHRVRGINRIDARAEGFAPLADGGDEWHAFLDYWNVLHGDHATDANPEVIALTFTVHKINIDDFLRQRESPRPAGPDAGTKEKGESGSRSQITALKTEDGRGGKQPAPNPR